MAQLAPVKATWWPTRMIWHPAAENFLGNKVSLLVSYLSYEPDSALKMGGNEMPTTLQILSLLSIASSD